MVRKMVVCASFAGQICRKHCWWQKQEFCSMHILYFITWHYFLAWPNATKNNTSSSYLIIGYASLKIKIVDKSNNCSAVATKTSRNPHYWYTWSPMRHEHYFPVQDISTFSHVHFPIYLIQVFPNSWKILTMLWMDFF